MKIKTTLAAVAMTLAAAAPAFAECSWSKQQAMNCADGMIYSPETGSCVTVNS